MYMSTKHLEQFFRMALPQTKSHLNEPLRVFLLPPHYCGLGAGSIPLRAVVNQKQCELRGLFMLLVIHY